MFFPPFEKRWSQNLSKMILIYFLFCVLTKIFFIIFGSTKTLPYRPQTIKFVYARLLLQSRYGSTAPSRREPMEISATYRIQAASNKSVSLPLEGRSPSNGETSAKLTEGAARKRGNPSEPKFAMRLTEGVCF